MNNLVAKYLEVSIGAIPFGHARKIIKVSGGQTVTEILGDIPPHEHHDIIVISRDRVIECEEWHVVHPSSDYPLYVNVVPRGEFLNIAAIIGLAIVAPIAAGALGGALGLAAGGLGVSLLTGGLFALGGLLINSIFGQPVVGGSVSRDPQRFSLQGTRNQLPNSSTPVLCVMGTHRVVPYLACKPYSYVIDSKTTGFRALYDFGYGPVDFDTDTFKFGESPISSFENVVTSMNDGSGTANSALAEFPVVRDQVTLNREVKALEPIVLNYGVGVTSVVYVMQYNALVSVNKKGDKDPATVEYTIEKQESDETAYTRVAVQKDTGNTTSQYFSSVAVTTDKTKAGMIRITRTTDVADETRLINASTLTTVDTVTDTPPVRVPGRALVYVQAVASQELQGTLQHFSAVVTRKIPVYTGSRWTNQRAGRASNPAWQIASVLRGPGIRTAVDDDDIDGDTLVAFADYCDTRGYRFDGVWSDVAGVWDRLVQLAVVGRASPNLIDGRMYSVVMDRRQTVPVDLITPRDSLAFMGTKEWQPRPDAFRATFNNRDNSYIQSQVVIYDEGVTEGTAKDVRSFDVTAYGVTHVDEVHKLIRFILAEARLRPEQFSITQDVKNLRITRGDYVDLSHDIPLIGLGYGRVLSTGSSSGRTTFTLDEDIDLTGDGPWMARFQQLDGTALVGGVVKSGTESFGTGLVRMSQAHAMGDSEIVVIGDGVVFLQLRDTFTLRQRVVLHAAASMGDTTLVVEGPGHAEIAVGDEFFVRSLSSITHTVSAVSVDAGDMTNTLTFTPGLEEDEMPMDMGSDVLFLTAISGATTYTITAIATGDSDRESTLTVSPVLPMAYGLRTILVLTSPVAGRFSAADYVFLGTGSPPVGAVCAIGVSGTEILQCLVRSIRAFDDLSAEITLVPLANDVHAAEEGTIPDYEITTNAGAGSVGGGAPTMEQARMDNDDGTVTVTYDDGEQETFDIGDITTTGGGNFSFFRRVFVMDGNTMSEVVATRGETRESMQWLRGTHVVATAAFDWDVNDDDELFIKSGTLSTGVSLVSAGMPTDNPREYIYAFEGVDIISTAVFDARVQTGDTGLGPRVDTAETNITALQGDVSTLQTDVSALESNVTTLQGRVPSALPRPSAANAGKLVGLSASAYTAVEAPTGGDGGGATEMMFNALVARVVVLEGYITAMLPAPSAAVAGMVVGITETGYAAVAGGGGGGGGSVIGFATAMSEAFRDSTAMVVVDRAFPRDGEITVAYGVSGTATSGDDFTALSGMLTIADGAGTGTIGVSIASDADGNDTIILTLTAGTGYQVNPAVNTHTLTVNALRLLPFTLTSPDNIMGDSDTDRYDFRTSGTTTSVVALLTGLTVGNAGDVNLGLYRTSDDRNIKQLSATRGQALTLGAMVPADNYYVAVEGDDSDTDTPYTLRVLTPDYAGHVLSTSNPLTITGGITGQSDLDISAFRLSARTSVVGLLTGTATGTAGDISFDILNADGSATNLDGFASRGDAIYDGKVLAAGDYYVIVGDMADGDTDTSYNLRILAPDYAGHVLSSSNPLTVTSVDNIVGQSDADIYAFRLSAEATVSGTLSGRVSTRAAPLGWQVWTTVGVRTAIGASSFSTGDVTDSATLAAGDYYIIVDGLADRTNTPYSLNITTDAADIVDVEGIQFASASSSATHRSNSNFAAVVPLTVPASRSQEINVQFTLTGTATLLVDYGSPEVIGGPSNLEIDTVNRNAGMFEAVIPTDAAAGKMNISIVFNGTNVTVGETVILTLTDGTGYTLGTTKVHTITVVSA